MNFDNHLIASFIWYFFLYLS